MFFCLNSSQKLFITFLFWVNDLKNSLTLTLYNKIIEFDQNAQIADINLKSYFLRAEEISTGLFSARTDIILTNILTNTENTYTVESAVKDITCNEQISAINLGTEVHLINLNGWLEKKYTSTQEIKDIVLGTSVAGIVYRDKIKIITF